MPPLRARAPLDLDLEDHLIFGLTPVRFGYLAIGALAAYALGGHTPGALGLPLALLLLGIAAAFAWLRWHGRPLDAWLLDVAIHARRNLEVEVDPVLLRRIRAPLRRSLPLRTIAVSGSAPHAGATTVAVELGAALAMKGRRVTVRPQRVPGVPLSTNASGVHAGSGLVVSRAVPADSECVIFDLGARLAARRADLALVVVSGSRPSAPVPPERRRAKHVEVIANRAGRELPGVTHAIPEDASVPAAQDAGEAVILQFPGSRAAAAFRRLADAVDPAGPSPWPPGSSEVPPAG
jgi:hypothetical protein